MKGVLSLAVVADLQGWWVVVVVEVVAAVEAAAAGSRGPPVMCFHAPVAVAVRHSRNCTHAPGPFA